MSTLSQFVGGSPIKSIQRGTISLGAGVVSNTATISSVDTAKTQMNWLGAKTTANVNATDWGYFALTNATTITFARDSSATGYSNTLVGSYEVIEYN